MPTVADPGQGMRAELGMVTAADTAQLSSYMVSVKACVQVEPSMEHQPHLVSWTLGLGVMS